VNRRPENDDELHSYIWLYHRWRIPRASVCHGHCSVFDWIAAMFFERDGDQITIGPRGGGKTLGYAVEEHMELKFNGDHIANIGAIDEQAKKCYSYLDRFCRLPYFRDDLLKPPMMSKTYFKNGGFIEIMPGTMKRVNSPHPRIAAWDEVELIDPEVLQEGASMPIRMGDRPPVVRYTSSLKFAHGPMMDLLDKAALPDSTITVRKFCVYEVMEKCPPARHQDGEGCKTCPLADSCLEKRTNPDGSTALARGPGRAARADGWMRIDDVIAKFRALTADVWNSQWLCRRPQTSGLVYPQFDPDLHITEYHWNPQLPVICGLDFGYHNPSVALYAQVTPTDEIVVFAEDYRPFRTTPEFAESIKAAPFFAATSWRSADPAGADPRAILQRMGVRVEPADNRKEEGLNLVRWLLKPQGRSRPLLYFTANCVNTLKEIRTYHYPHPMSDRNLKEEPQEFGDHAMDALRYMAMRLFRGRLNVGKRAS
jgi:hypothetical protein